MRTFLIAFALAFFFGIALTWLIRNLAIRWKLYDQPEGRKIHSEPIPRLGGIAVAIAFSVPILALTLWTTTSPPPSSQSEDCSSRWSAAGVSFSHSEFTTI